MRPVSWAILGCGRVAEHRVAPAIVASAAAELAAFCSRTRERAQEFAERFGARRGHAGIDELLRDDDVEAVYVATPNALHADQAIALLKAGRHVLVDKPMALSAADAARMAAAAKQAGRTLGVLHQQRFHPAHAECFRRLREGALGRPTLIRAQMGYLARPDGRWRQDPSMSGGGPGMDLGPHAVDIVLKAFGLARTVRGRTANARFDYAVEDLFVAQLDFAGGGAGLVEVDFCAYSQGGRLEIRGDEGTFVGEGSLMASDEYRWRLYKGYSRRPVERAEGEFRDCFVAAIDDFSRAVREGREPAVSADDGVAVMRVIEAAYSSAESGLPVELES